MALAGRQGYPLKGQSLCGAVPLWMLVGRCELLRLRQTGIAPEQQEERKRSSRCSRPFDHVRVTKYDSLSSLRRTATVQITQTQSFSQHSPYKDQPYIQKELKPVRTSLWSGTSAQHIY